jgi:WD40 repeat protein
MFRLIMYLSSAQFAPNHRFLKKHRPEAFATIITIVPHHLQVLSGHEGPVTTLAFSPKEPVLASGSWDHTIKFWDVYKSCTATETIETPSDTLALAFRPDGQEVSTVREACLVEE